MGFSHPSPRPDASPHSSSPRSARSSRQLGEVAPGGRSVEACLGVADGTAGRMANLLEKMGSLLG